MAKRPEQTAITVRNLTQAFWRLYCLTPIEKISVAQVAETAGYNRGTFYLHFQDIYDVLHRVEDDLLDDMRVCVQTCMESLEAGVDPEIAMQQVLAFYEERREYLVVLLGENGDPAFVSKLKQQLKPLWATYVLKRPAKATGAREASGDDAGEVASGAGVSSMESASGTTTAGAAVAGTAVTGTVASKATTEAVDSETDFILEYTLSGTLFMVRRWLENPHGISAEKLLHLIYHSAIKR